MKSVLIVLLFIIPILIFAQDVVINEVLYDPNGLDGGYEWIELYNNSSSTVNLLDWYFEKGGTSFEHVYTFPNIIIEPDSFLLIGEEFVPDCDLTEDLAFQNGGSETDGIRLTSADGLYTDTILYDSPNSNSLPDDVTNPGEHFAVDVASGNTLARIADGEDSNNCEADFFECSQPTPGAANIYPIDLAISNLEITPQAGGYLLEMEVENLSTVSVYNMEASIDIAVNDTLYGTYGLPAIPAQSTINYSCSLNDVSYTYLTISVFLNYIYDNELSNNLVVGSILNNDSPLVLNEIMFKPLSTNQEWVELFNRSDCAYDVDNLRITDESGGTITFNANIDSNDFIVVCQDSFSLIQTYPQIDPEKIVIASDWTSLNNTEETLILEDAFETKFDSTSYNGNSCPADFTFERVNPYEDENIEWLVCSDSLGTPAFPNSVLPVQFDLELKFTELEQNENSFTHSLTIKNVGLENINSAIVSCEILKNDNGDIDDIFTDEIMLEDSLLYQFETDLVSDGYYTFCYDVIADEDLNIANNFDVSFYNSNSLPFVINEIMYDPLDDEPEWIELTNNFSVTYLNEIVVIINNDTLQVPFCNEDYYLLTNSSNDADSLRMKYGLENTTIYTGLPGLSNSGALIKLMDNYGNIIEEFFYDPDWNNELDGVSIERVNPVIISSTQNWGPSVSSCTAGERNSIYVQILPTNMKLNVAPNPFSPYNEERTIFSFTLPEVISTVTIRIFDLKGRLIRKLVDQQNQAANGNLIWDGKNDNGKICPIGVYIVLMQATARGSEKVYSKKCTVVIGK